MARIKALDISHIKRDLFANEYSYSAAKYAVDVINNMIKQHNAGNVIINYERVIKPKFQMILDTRNNFKRIEERHSINGDTNFTTVMGERVDIHTGKILLTKKEVRAYFSLYRILWVLYNRKVSDI